MAEIVRFGDKIKVFYQNGECRLYEASQIDFETDILKSNAAAGQNMAYFQRLVQEIRQRNPEDPVIAPFEGIARCRIVRSMRITSAGRASRWCSPRTSR